MKEQLLSFLKKFNANNKQFRCYICFLFLLIFYGFFHKLSKKSEQFFNSVIFVYLSRFLCIKFTYCTTKRFLYSFHKKFKQIFILKIFEQARRAQSLKKLGGSTPCTLVRADPSENRASCDFYTGPHALRSQYDFQCNFQLLLNIDIFCYESYK